MSIVTARNVSKQIKGNTVLNDINLNVEENECVAIYGKNGSGKSMLLKAVCGFVSIQKGTIEVMGTLVGRKGYFAPDTGCLIERPGFFGHLSGRKNLEELLRISPKSDHYDISEMMRRFELDPLNKKPYKNYSLGMKQKLGIIQAILTKPRLLVLDEPSNNLDERSAEILIEQLKTLKKAGTTILLASHDLEEISALADCTYQMTDGCLKEGI